jgi:Alpha galactosidase A
VNYNEPDMLIVGMMGFSGAQNRTHLALWAISSAPFLAGNNLATMNADTKSVLTNSELIAINQDPLAKQG